MPQVVLPVMMLTICLQVSNVMEYGYETEYHDYSIRPTVASNVAPR